MIWQDEYFSRHKPETAYWTVSGDRCTCPVGKKPDYDGHTHTDVVKACAWCGQLWGEDGCEVVQILFKIDRLLGDYKQRLTK